MTLSPPQPAQPGAPYYLFFDFYDYENGAWAEPTSLSLAITYGNVTSGLGAANTAGPFTYTGATTEGSDTIWRLAEGQYQARWDVPGAGISPGVYIANWTAGYGGDQFLAEENIPVQGAGPITPPPAGDTGYWTGSLTYQPSWAATPFTIPLGQVDANGTSWILKGVTGWDSPPVVGSVIQRSADHGGWPAIQVYGPRIITLDVMASAPTHALRDVARSQLQQAVAVGITPGDLTVFTYNEPVPKQALVRRNGGAMITEVLPTLCDAEFTIPLVAPDPRKYAVQAQSAQVTLPPPVVNPLVLPFASGGPMAFPGGIPPETITVPAGNAGTFETRPQITLTGPITGPQLVNGRTGQAISFTSLTLAASDLLTIDTDTRQCFLNGRFYAADPVSAWWVLQPGTTPIYVTGTTPGGAVLTVTWASAYV